MCIRDRDNAICASVLLDLSNEGYFLGEFRKISLGPPFKLFQKMRVFGDHAKTGEDFGANGGSKSARMAKLWQFSQGRPKPPFCAKVQRGDQGKFFKNHPKSNPSFKNPTAVWRKWPYPLISIQLKCKDCRKFWSKKQLEKCPNGQGMAIFAKSPTVSYTHLTLPTSDLV